MLVIRLLCVSFLMFCGGGAAPDGDLAPPAAPLPLDAQYDVVEVVLASAVPRCALHYTILVVEARARGGGAVRLVPSPSAAEHTRRGTPAEHSPPAAPRTQH